jgi:hypothetical protein
MFDELLKAALAFAQMGFAVFPSEPRGKTPLVKHGFKAATRDETQIRAWWSRWPDANIGIATGAASRLLVVDIDNLDGAKRLGELAAQFGKLTLTPRVNTGNGHHLHYRLPADSGRVPSSAENGLDIRADGGYVIAPPSVHASGRRYEWDFTYAKDIADAPQWLIDFARKRKVAPKAKIRAEQPTGAIPDVGLRPLAASTQSPVPWSEAEQARLESALKYVDAKDYQPWLEVGFVLHDLAKNDARWPGRQMWDEWSRSREEKFDEARQEKEWSNFGRRDYKGPRVTVATIYRWAQQNGWVNPFGALPPADDANAPPRQSQADSLNSIALRRAELFHAPDGTGYANIEVNGHRETWPIRSRGFRRWLCHAYYEQTAKAANSEAQQSALGVIEARAQFASLERTVHVRVAGLDDKLYLDLCDPAWRVVEIDAVGWRVIDQAPVRFRRAAGMKPLPVPERGGAVSELRPFLNVAAHGDFALVVAWLLACLHDRGPYPILAVSGEQGSAKSTACAMLRALIDPNTAPLRSLPREDRDLFIAANNGHVLVFDNVSIIAPWLADALCRIATGGGFQVRELYADKEEVLFDACRPIMSNGIEDVVTRPDLADRALFLNLGAISEDRRRPEREIWAAFNAALPRILGALLDAVSIGLQRLSSTRLERHPRMADFCLWTVACGDGTLWLPGAFLSAYEANRDDAVGNVLDADPLVTALRALMAKGPSCIGTATDLLSRLSLETGDANSRLKAWPKNARALAGRMRRLAPSLRKVGFDIDFERGQGPTRERIIRISVTPESGALRTSTPSPPSKSIAFQ